MRILAALCLVAGLGYSPAQAVDWDMPLSNVVCNTVEAAVDFANLKEVAFHTVTEANILLGIFNQKKEGRSCKFMHLFIPERPKRIGVFKVRDGEAIVIFSIGVEEKEYYIGLIEKLNYL